MKGMKYNMTFIKPDKTEDKYMGVERRHIIEIVQIKLKEYYNLEYTFTITHFASLQMGFGGKFLRDIVKLEKIKPVSGERDRESRLQYAREYYHRRKAERMLDAV